MKKSLVFLLLLVSFFYASPSIATTLYVSYDHVTRFGKVPVGQSRDFDIVIDEVMFNEKQFRPYYHGIDWPRNTLYSRLYAEITYFDLETPPDAFLVQMAGNQSTRFRLTVNSLLADVGKGPILLYAMNYYNMYETAYDRYGRITGEIGANDYFDPVLIASYTAVLSPVPVPKTFYLLFSGLLALACCSPLNLSRNKSVFR